MNSKAKNSQLRAARIAHVGLGKTATSFLQRNFFPASKYNFFSTISFESWPNELSWLYLVNLYWLKDFYSRSFIWSREDREAFFKKAVLKERSDWVRLGRKLMQNETSPMLLSAEGLIGFSVPTAQFIGSLLSEVGVEKIIFVYRNQADWSISLWKQLILAEDRFAHFVSYEDFFLRPLESSVIDMDWTQYLESYIDIFGENNVLAIPYEMLVGDPDIFFKKLKLFMEDEEMITPDASIKENVSGEEEFYYSCKLNRYGFFSATYNLRSIMHKIGKRLRVGKNKKISSIFFEKQLVPKVKLEVRQELLQHFESSNRRLALLTGVDLAKYGYYK